jgi:hypothetical protein
MKLQSTITLEQFRWIKHENMIRWSEKHTYTIDWHMLHFVLFDIDRKHVCIFLEWLRERRRSSHNTRLVSRIIDRCCLPIISFQNSVRISIDIDTHRPRTSNECVRLISIPCMYVFQQNNDKIFSSFSFLVSFFDNDCKWQPMLFSPFLLHGGTMKYSWKGLFLSLIFFSFLRNISSRIEMYSS